MLLVQIQAHGGDDCVPHGSGLLAFSRALVGAVDPEAVDHFLRRNGTDLNTPLRIGAVAFDFRFESSLNSHVHFHARVVNGVFKVVANGDTADPATPPGITFHSVVGLYETAIAESEAKQL